MLFPISSESRSQHQHAALNLAAPLSSPPVPSPTANPTHHLPLPRTSLDIRNQLLLLPLQLGPFPIQLALRLLEGPLVLPQPLCGSLGAAEEGFLRVFGAAVGW